MARVLQTAAGPARRAELARQAAASTAGPPSTSYLMRLEKLASESDQLVTAADTVIQDIFDAALYAKETGNDGMVAELKASLKTALLKQNELRTRAAELRRAKEEGTSAEEVAKYAARAIAEVRTPSPPPASLLPPCLSLAAWPDSFFSFGLVWLHRTRGASGSTSSGTARSGGTSSVRSRGSPERPTQRRARSRTRTSQWSV